VSAKMNGRELFDTSVLRHANKKAVFYQFAALLLGQARLVRRGSVTHAFLRRLFKRGQLVRCYTQNIDGIERTVQLSPELSSDTVRGGLTDEQCQVVQLHGDINKVRCTICAYRDGWPPEAIEAALQGRVIECPRCLDINRERSLADKRKRGVGELRPDILLYEETHWNEELVPQYVQADVACHPTALLIMGTSLTIPGCQEIVKEFARGVHQAGGRVVWINPTRPNETRWAGVVDDVVLMESDLFISALEHMWDTSEVEPHSNGGGDEESLRRQTLCEEAKRLRRRNLTSEEGWQIAFDNL